ncbi:MAG: cytochrome b/b6 domain-containing protein [Granulosicoccus sp.]
MSNQQTLRYGDIAVLFHWLIAFFIIGLLAIGKYMTGLEENDPVRFALTQWHKSFGLTVLFLSILRLVWRFGHRPPPDPETIPNWQKSVAHGVHILLYSLMFILPISGWIMVSASPLDINTVLFDVVTVPHIPPFDQLANKEQVEGWFVEIHDIAGNILILLLLAHAGAAMKHHFVDKDTVLVRMLPDLTSRSFKNRLAAMALLIGATGTGLYLYADSGNQAAILAAGDSEVSFIANVTGEPAPGAFTESKVSATIDQNNLSASSIMAAVQTGTITSSNSQLESTLPETEWFNVADFPEALFESTTVASDGENTLRVTGSLTIKDKTQEVSFPMTITSEESTQVARGEFVINRQDYDIGMDSQGNEDFVGFDVTVKFRFNISTPDA